MHRRRWVAATVAALLVGAFVAAPVAATASAPTDQGDPTTLIIGGKEAREREARAAVSIHVDGRFVCSGTAVRILDRTAVLTAAHCVTEAPAGVARTQAGGSWLVAPEVASRGTVPEMVPMGLAVRTGRDRTTGPLIGWTRVVVMPGWSWGVEPGRVSDAALIDPAQPLRGVVPLPLGDARTGQVVRAVGWGLTAIDATEPPTRVQAATLRTVQAARCAGTLPAMSAGEVCVAAPHAAPYYGDSGGPIIGLHGGRLAVQGIASRGGAASGGPAIYTAADRKLREWAEARVRGWNRDDAAMEEELERDQLSGLVPVPGGVTPVPPPSVPPPGYDS